MLAPLIKRCLEKDRKARVSDIGVARFLMTETLPASVASTAGTCDGKLLVVVAQGRVTSGAGQAIQVVLNWSEELKQRVQTK